MKSSRAKDSEGGTRSKRFTYASAGVNITKVGRIHSALTSALGATFSTRNGKKGMPLLPIGHYAGVVDLGGNAALALHTDGVGSKVLVAQKMRKFDTIGIDCVAMTANDLICVGAEPFALLDYIALQRENGPLVSEISKGLARGAKLASAAIVGGETAIMGDLVRGLGGNGFDLVCMGAGFVSKRKVLDGSKIKEGDLVLGVESSGLHSNGYTLVRKVLGDRLGERPPGLGSTIGKALLTPTRVYVGPTLSALRNHEVHAIGHITGGAFSKLRRLLVNKGLQMKLRLPPPPPIFRLVQGEGRISDLQMLRTLNMGIGLCLILPGHEGAGVARTFRRSGFGTHELGEVRRGTGVTVNGIRVA